MKKDEDDLILSKYIVSTEYDDAIIIFSTKLGKILKISTAVWECLCTGNLDILPTEIKEYLITNQILVSSNEDEFTEILKQNEIINTDNTTLYEVIQPSAYCQMGCFYCGQNHQNINLSEKNIINIVDAIERKIEANNFTALRIGWFGAEPLIGMNSMFEITNRLKEICNKANIIYSAKIITNGLKLTESIFHDLYNKLSVDFIEITIDGIEETHNKRRNLKNSDNGTFKTIIRNLENIIQLKAQRNYNIEISIRCNVDKGNQNTVIPLINFLKEKDILNRVNFYSAKIHEWGDKSNDEVVDFDYPSQEIFWFQNLIENGKGVSLLPKRVYNVCLATNKNSSVYDAYGNVFKCTEVPYITNDDQSEFFLGKFNQSEIRDLDFADKWNSNVKDGKSHCLHCNFFPVCGGACPKSWLDGNVPCPSFKFNMPERLRLYYDTIKKN